MKKNLKKILKWTIIGGLCLVFLVLLPVLWGCNAYVEHVSKRKMYDSVKDIPANRVGLLLGTNPVSTVNHKRNPYYYYRIDAAVALYKAGKIERILVSGDNRRKSYNEPDMMKADLVARGIPAEHIYCDYAGFRTLDSVVRANKVFQLDKFTVISQSFHNERAICLGHWKGLDVIGYNARGISLVRGFRVFMRERLTRVKFVLDMLMDKQPHFLGDEITIH